MEAEAIAERMKHLSYCQLRLSIFTLILPHYSRAGFLIHPGHGMHKDTLFLRQQWCDSQKRDDTYCRKYSSSGTPTQFPLVSNKAEKELAQSFA